MVTYEEYDQHNDEKDNPDVKKKLGIRIVDLVQQGLRQVELQFVLMWVETLTLSTYHDKKFAKFEKKTIDIPSRNFLPVPQELFPTYLCPRSPPQ